MKALLSILAAFLLACSAARAANGPYAVAVYGSITSEAVIVMGPIESCDAALLANYRKTVEPTIAPSLSEIGYACASRDQIRRLSSPVCEISDGSTPSDAPAVWVYACVRGIADALVRPPPTAAELEQRREMQKAAEKAAEIARQQTVALAAERAARIVAQQHRAVDWVNQQRRAACMQTFGARRLPGQDDPTAICNRSSADGNPQLALIQYCSYLRSAHQPENIIHAACDAS
jgi:hypothetical protein